MDDVADENRRVVLGFTEALQRCKMMGSPVSSPDSRNLVHLESTIKAEAEATATLGRSDIRSRNSKAAKRYLASGCSRASRCSSFFATTLGPGREGLRRYGWDVGKSVSRLGSNCGSGTRVDSDSPWNTTGFPRNAN